MLRRVRGTELVGIGRDKRGAQVGMAPSLYPVSPIVLPYHLCRRSTWHFLQIRPILQTYPR